MFSALQEHWRPFACGGEAGWLLWPFDQLAQHGTDLDWRGCDSHYGWNAADTIAAADAIRKAELIAKPN